MRRIDNSVCLSEFGDWVRTARKGRGLSQTEVATLVGVSQPWYCRIESADREVDLITAMRICQVLGLDLSDFIKTHM